MLRSMNDLEGYAIRATDGTIGHVKISISMTKRGHPLSGCRHRQLALEPEGVDIAYRDRQPELGGKDIARLVTKEQVKSSPEIDTEKRCPGSTNAVPRLLRLSVLLGWCGALGWRSLPGHDDDGLRWLRFDATCDAASRGIVLCTSGNGATPG